MPAADNIPADAPKTATKADPAPAAPPVAAEVVEAAPAPATAPADPVEAVTDADPRAASIDRIFEAWLHDHIAGGPLARHTEGFNHLQASLPALKAALLGD